MCAASTCGRVRYVSTLLNVGTSAHSRQELAPGGRARKTERRPDALTEASRGAREGWGGAAQLARIALDVGTSVSGAGGRAQRETLFPRVARPGKKSSPVAEEAGGWMDGSAEEAGRRRGKGRGAGMNRLKLQNRTEARMEANSASALFGDATLSLSLFPARPSLSGALLSG